MQIYLPIAELPLDILLVLSLGALGGILAGMFGIGGGFLLTPLLIFNGVPPAVAVATSTHQIIASSVSGFLSHLYRQNVDVKMGLFLLAGGLIGGSLGIWLFAWLQSLGQIDLAISLFYVIFLGFIGTLMGLESSQTILRRKKTGTTEEAAPTARLGHWIRQQNLPWVVYFPRSDLHISALIPITIGLFAGALVSLMGIGGGFVMIPAMIYLLGMPSNVVVGTSLFQIMLTTSLVTLLHAINTQTVDIVLGALLIIGGVLGAQLGTKLALKLPSEKLRGLLALIVLGVCIKLGAGLLVEPENLYSIEVVEE